MIDPQAHAKLAIAELSKIQQAAADGGSAPALSRRQLEIVLTKHIALAVREALAAGCGLLSKEAQKVRP